jgi:23S rRNA pseudouridine1911/1915/1917 synthase
MPLTPDGWLITPEELKSWILELRSDLVVLNKPPRVVCHPSMRGPWSSLVGACREYLGVERLHMPFRLDRETSGVLIFATDLTTGRRLQRAVLRRDVRKTYMAIVEGSLSSPATVDGPIGRDPNAEFFSRQAVVPGGQTAVTELIPLKSSAGYTLVQAHPLTGRRHQIRVHAAHLGHPIVGDKLYGPDPRMMLDLMKNGFREEDLDGLQMSRHALHASEVVFRTPLGDERFAAPMPDDMVQFWNRLQAG